MYRRVGAVPPGDDGAQFVDRAGGEDYLLRQADQEPKAFMALLGRVLPMQVQGTGDKGEIVHRVIREIVRP